jgi:type IV pilus assembly protein PilO
MAISLSDPAQRNKLIIGLIPLVAAFAYWYMFYGARTTEITDLKTHFEDLDTKNTAAKKIAARGGPELKKKLAVYEQHMIRLEELIPRDEEVPELLHTITLRAGESGVELSLVKPEKSTPGQFYTKESYSLGVIGSYHGIGSFLSAIGSLPRIITPIGLTLRPRPDLDKSGAQKVDASFKIETYVVPKVVPAAPPSGAPPPPANTAGGKPSGKA